MGNYESNYEGYEHLKLYPDESQVVTLMKGLLGAVVGAVPGMALWIILGRVGIIASVCGMLLAAGVILGYSFMTKKGELPSKYAIIICLAVLVITVYMSEKIVWTWVLADSFQDYLPTIRDMIINQAELEGLELTGEQINELITDEMINDMLIETYGFTEGTFSDCFSHFGDLLELLEVKADFYSSLGKSYLFAFIGGFGLFAKIVSA